jgi:D-alanine-D-alanine ligase-like ATP-grasp enzyme
VLEPVSSAAPIPRHYHYVTRMLLDLFRSSALPDVVSVEVEPEWGYTTRIRYRDGRARLTYGNDVGLNPGSAEDVAKDKDYTKWLLARDGFTVPRGSSFLATWWADHLAAGSFAMPRERMRTTAQAAGYAQRELGFPVYVKPVRGSKGGGISRCAAAADLELAIAELEALRTKVVLVEEAVALPDYRLVVLHGELISAYRRNPLAVAGDGRATVGELLRELDAHFRAIGRDTRIALDDPRIERRLTRLGLGLRSVPAPGRVLIVSDISNLSAGGTADDVTARVARRWRELGRDVAASFGLAFCGVDLACADIESDDAEHCILEVNATPGLDHYAAVGERQERVVRDLYAQVLNAAPGA